MNLDLLSLKGKKEQQKKHTEDNPAGPSWTGSRRGTGSSQLCSLETHPSRENGTSCTDSKLLPSFWADDQFHMHHQALWYYTEGNTSNQTGRHDHNLPGHESCHSNQGPSLSLLALSRQRTHTLGAASSNR